MSDPKPETFEQKMGRLEGLVRDIEEGKVGLEDSIRRYEEGMVLLKACRKILADAEQRITMLQQAEDGSLDPAPEDPGRKNP